MSWKHDLGTWSYDNKPTPTTGAITTTQMSFGGVSTTSDMRAVSNLTAGRASGNLTPRQSGRPSLGLVGTPRQEASFRGATSQGSFSGRLSEQQRVTAAAAMEESAPLLLEPLQPLPPMTPPTKPREEGMTCTPPRQPQQQQGTLPRAEGSGWVTVFAVEPEEMMEVIRAIEVRYGCTEGHIWPGWLQCNWFHLKFQDPLNAARAAFQGSLSVIVRRDKTIVVGIATCNEAPQLPPLSVAPHQQPAHPDAPAHVAVKLLRRIGYCLPPRDRPLRFVRVAAVSDWRLWISIAFLTIALPLVAVVVTATLKLVWLVLASLF